MVQLWNQYGQSTSIIKHNQSANSLEFTPNSNAGKKLEINDTGIDVTGTATMDGLTVEGLSNATATTTFSNSKYSKC